ELSYTPAANANGTATITLRLGDDGGTGDGGVDTSATQTFEIAVTAVNDVPSFDLIASPDQAVLEDSPQQTVAAFASNMSPGPADEAGQTLTFDVSNDNNALFAGQPVIDELTGDLVYTPAASTTGTATVTVFLADDGGTANAGVDQSASVTFDIVVFPPNFTPVADSQTGASAAVVVEDTATTITLTATDADDDDLTFTIVGSPSGALGSLGPIDCTTTLNTCTTTVLYTPVSNSNADDSFTFKVNDGTIDSNTATVDVTITPVNDAPSFSHIGSQFVIEDAGPQSEPFVIGMSAGPANESAQTLSFEVTNNTNPGLFSAGPSIAPDGTLSYTTAANAHGEATVTLRVRDNGGTDNGGVDASPTQEFLIWVGSINDTPSFTKGADTTVLEDAGAQSVSGWATAISPGPADEAGQTVSFDITDVTNSGLFSTAPVVAADGTLSYTPAANANGTSTITLRVVDSGIGANTSATQSFVLTVTPVNDAPSFTKGANQTVLEDAGAQTVNPWATGLSAGPADESSQTLSFSVTGNTNSGLFSAGPAISPSGVLTYTPAANANGSATITLTVSDNGGTANSGANTSASQDFTITVTPVNDAPSFDTLAGDPATVAEDATVQTVTGFATGMGAGPANESAQTLTFVVTNDNNGLFSVQPAVSASGTLTYTPAANQHGTATITIKLTDNGGTANSGDDDSATQQFTITVTAVNDAPSSLGRAYGAASVQTNMRRSFDAASGLLVGATDAADTGANAGYTPAFTVGTVNSVAPDAGTITTTIAGVGTVVVDTATGAFTLDPAPGVTGAVSFGFTVCDSGDGSPVPLCTGSVTASFDIAGSTIWFVDPAALTNGNGTLASPFKTLVAADAVDAANHRVFVYSGSTATGLTLNSGEWLVGQSATGSFDTVFGINPPAGTIARPTLSGGTATIGGTVTLATNSKVQGVAISTGTNAGLVGAGPLTGIIVSESSVTTTTGTAVNLTGAVGTYSLSSVSTNGAANGIVLDDLGNSGVTVSGGSIVSASTRGVDINLGSGNFTFGGTITTTATGRSVEVTNHTSGTVSLNGAVSDTGLGVNLASNSGSNIGFGGGLTANTGANTAFSATGGGTITLTGVSHTLTTTTGTALNLNGVGGTFTFASVTTNGAANGILVDNVGTAVVAGNGGSIVGATSRGVDINGGTANFTYAGSITTSGTGRSVEVTGHGGPSTVLFSGSVTDNGSGINLSSNTGATIRFTGGITASTGTNAAFAATGGGTVAVTGAANTLTTTTGTALNVTSTTIHADGLTFRSISSNGAAKGIVLDTTGGSGSLTVTGNGGTCTAADTSGCSGGHIQNSAGGDDSSATPVGTGIVLNSTNAPSFTRMWLNGHSNYAIRGTTVAGFTLADSVINGTNGTNDAGPYRDASVAFDGLTGNPTVSNSAISGGYADNVRVINASGSLNRITFSSVTIGANSTAGGNDGILLESSGTASFNATIQNSTFTSARGDLLQFGHGGSGAGDLVVTGNAFSNNHAGIATGGGGVSLSNEGTSGSTTMNIANNTFRDAVGHAVLIVKSTGASTQTGTFSGNTIGVSGLANSGSKEGDALKLQTAGQGTLSWTVSNNQIFGYNNYGIEVLAGGGATAYGGTINTTITGNTIAQPGNTAGTLAVSKNGIHFNIGTVVGDTYAACAVIGGSGGLANSISTAGLDAVPASGVGDIDFRFRQRQSTTIRLPGYAGANNDNTAVQGFVSANNAGNGASAGLAANTVATGGGGFTGTGSSCP
ncbi:MAG: tandem-95 repeat protein, partial [Actinomycetota bacterium]|nr:tandem-95 repeat protein [Actinomycetota bacterium]